MQEILIHSLSHLSPSDLLSTSLVCNHFHDLVTQPDAWRTAFARYFPAASILPEVRPKDRGFGMQREKFESDKRSFARLTVYSSWRTEYTVRVRLLRSLSRGRPVTPIESSPVGKSGRRSSGFAVVPVALHDTQSTFPITSIHANFENASGSKSSNAMFGAHFNGEARLMNPTTGKLDRSWSTWNDVFVRKSFTRLFPDQEMWGMGSGQLVGNPNPVAISRQYGIVVGEGCGDGRVSFHAVGEHTQQFLQTTSWTSASSTPTLGMPNVPTNREGISSVWLAKSPTIPSLSNGMVGILSGSSCGIVSAYSLGHVGMRDRSIVRGELTARWVLSPGVPITSIIVDDHYSLKRQAQNRVWAVALNALGELFYLTKFPKRVPAASRPVDNEKGARVERLAWLSARSVSWNQVEPSRRTSVPDPYGDKAHDGSYSPRSSWDGMCLSEDQIRAETVEITKFLHRRPIEFRQDCIGWDMRRRVEVDFAGDDGNFAGEAIFVVTNRPSSEGIRASAGIKRYVRVKSIKAQASKAGQFSSGPSTPRAASPDRASRGSLFGPQSTMENVDSISTKMIPTPLTSANEEWLASDFKMKLNLLVTCIAIDNSIIANMTLSEDPLVAANGGSTTSSGSSSPSVGYETVSDVSSIPGHRARLIAVGTNLGFIYVWNMRAPLPKSQAYNHIIEPVRIIAAGAANYTEVTCLALNSLMLVHGDSEGLVQAWDPLASQDQPLRTISSPFTGRVRRRVLEAEATSDHNLALSGAGAIALDPDPTNLRGLVAIGSHVKYWHFRSDGVVGLGSRGGKRRRRKESRGGQSGTPSGVSRGGIAGFIEDEVRDLTDERKRERKERHRLQQRFGVGMLEEDEELQLAIMMSEEAFETQSELSTPRLSTATTSMVGDGSDDNDIAEAIRRSLQESATDSPTRIYTPSSPSPSPSPSAWGGSFKISRRGRVSPGRRSPKADIVSREAEEASDLELALMLSLADQDTSSSAHVSCSSSAGTEKGKERGP